MSQVKLDGVDCSLGLELSQDGRVAETIQNPAFDWLRHDVRGSHGTQSSSYVFEMKITRNLLVRNKMKVPHSARIGFSLETCGRKELGWTRESWGYGSTGKISHEKQFQEGNNAYGIGDVVAASLQFHHPGNSISIKFYHNGKLMKGSFQEHLSTKVTVFPHINLKNVQAEINFSREFSPFPLCYHDVPFLGDISWDHLVMNPAAKPCSFEDSVLIMMVGLPGSGKTTFQEEIRGFEVLSTNDIIHDAKVDGLRRRNNYHGRFNAIASKSMKMFQEFLEQVLRHPPRNYIIDQTNWKQSARVWKLKYFEHFGKRIAVVCMPTLDVLLRNKIAQDLDGKIVPLQTYTEMISGFTFPSLYEGFTDILFAEGITMKQAQNNFQSIRQTFHAISVPAPFAGLSGTRAYLPPKQNKKVNSWKQSPTSVIGRFLRKENSPKLSEDILRGKNDAISMEAEQFAESFKKSEYEISCQIECEENHFYEFFERQALVCQSLHLPPASSFVNTVWISLQNKVSISVPKNVVVDGFSDLEIFNLIMKKFSVSSWNLPAGEKDSLIVSGEASSLDIALCIISYLLSSSSNFWPLRCYPKQLEHSQLALHSGFEKTLANLTLEQEHVAELVKRGIKVSQVEKCGFRSWKGGMLKIPVLSQDNDSMEVKNELIFAKGGLLIPCRNPEGLITALHIKPNNGAQKYMMVSKNKSVKLKSNEMPLFCYKPDWASKAGVIGLVEGGLKAHILTVLLGCIPIIGAVGGQFLNSETLLEEYLARMSAKRVIFFPDAGAVKNPLVMLTYLRNFRMLYSMGLEVSVAWWGQINKQEAADVDDLLALNGQHSLIRSISVEDFCVIFSEQYMGPIGEKLYELLPSNVKMIMPFLDFR